MNPANRLFLPALLLIAFSGPAFAAAPAKPLIYVPVLPYEYLFERIGGEWIEVHSVVGEGGDCHNYNPPPRQLAQMGKAHVLCSADLGFEGNFFVKVGDGVNGPKPVNLLEGLELLEGSCEVCEAARKEGHPEDAKAHQHEHEELKDPHVWLSPRMLLLLADKVAGLLIECTPPPAHPAIQANLQDFRKDVATVQAELTAALAPIKGQTFYVYHGAFAYFARDFGLVQKAIETYGRRPTPRQVADIAKQAKQDGVRLIFMQPQFDQSSAQSLAETIGGKVELLDPLEKDVLSNLRTIARTLRQDR